MILFRVTCILHAKDLKKYYQIRLLRCLSSWENPSYNGSGAGVQAEHLFSWLTSVHGIPVCATEPEDTLWPF